MTSFYAAISEHYDHIFPVKPAQVRFVLERLGQGRRVLEMGCATGNLTSALARASKKVAGIDLSAEMVERARRKAEGEGLSIDYRVMDMREMGSGFERSAFDGVVCVGNTLVHLASLEEIAGVLRMARRLLAPEGVLVTQTINYDRILDQELTCLSTVDNDHITFERRYQRDRTDGRIGFQTALTIKSQGKVLTHEVPLVPLRRRELNAAIRQAGFQTIDYWGSFAGEPFNAASSVPLIAVCG